MRTIETKIYKLHEHPDKELCFDWIRNNWVDLGDYLINEVISSIKTLNDHIGGSIDWSIGFYSQSCFVRFTDYDVDLLNDLNVDELPLTGCIYDAIVIECLKDNNFRKLFIYLDDEHDYLYSETGLTEMIECNDYEFLESGEVY